MIDTNHNRVNKSTIAKHSFKSKHHICFNQTKILASTFHYSSILIRESIKIEKHPNNFNQEDGYKLSRSWKPLIHQLTHHRYLTPLFTTLSFLLFTLGFYFILFILILINLLIYMLCILTVLSFLN